MACAPPADLFHLYFRIYNPVERVAKNKWTMPMMVSQLAGDMYKTEYGAVYLGLLLTVLPIFVIYFLLSKYIIAGVALGGVKE